MIAILIAAGLVFALFKLVGPLQRLEVDGFISVVFVLAPALIIFVLSILPLPAFLSVLYLGLYWLVPTWMLKSVNNLAWGEAARYGLIVFGVVMLVLLPSAFLVQAG